MENDTPLMIAKMVIEQLSPPQLGGEPLQTQEDELIAKINLRFRIIYDRMSKLEDNIRELARMSDD